MLVAGERVRLSLSWSMGPLKLEYGVRDSLPEYGVHAPRTGTPCQGPLADSDAHAG